MFSLKEVLAEDISAGVKAAGWGETAGRIPIVVKRTENEEHGDYASPSALALAKQVDEAPLDVVKKIVEHMPKREYIGRITAAPPGFLNIRLNPSWLASRLDDLIESDAALEVNVGRGKSANLEFISANPTGPLTLGNIRTAFSADTLANILAAADFDVTREYYFNDVGGQIVKLGESVLRRGLEARGEKIEYPEEMYQGDYVRELAALVAEQFKEIEGHEIAVSDLADGNLIRRAGELAARVMMERIKKMISEELKIKFNVWTSEEELKKSGRIEEVIKELTSKNLVYEKDGAKWLKTTEFGDSEDRVLVKGDGEYAYVAPDIAYHFDKFARGFDEIFTFVGADHQGHLPKIAAAMKALGKDIEHLHLITAQWLRVVRAGKPVSLSKRKGQIVTPADLIDEVGYDAARFFMVQHDLKTHMDFDLDLARERSERNPVYYVQYAYVRLQSILRQAKQRGVIDQVGLKTDLLDKPALTHSLELNLLRQMYRLPEVIVDITKNFTPHDLAYFAQDLARAVHVYYRHVPVLAAENEALVRSRLQLILGARLVLAKTLDLLGLGKPDVM